MSSDDESGVEGTSKAVRITDRLGKALADEAVNAIGILTIGYITAATNGAPGYEPIAAIASISLGAKYLANRSK